MKLNFDAPTLYMDQLYKYQDFLMCNAFTCAEDAKYRLFFREKSTEKHVILDTTTFNINQRMSMAELISLAEYVGAREIIAPYMFYNVERTLDQLAMFYKYLDDKNIMSKFNIIIVPQGNSLQDYVHNFSRFMRFPSDTLAIPANILSLEDTYRTEQLRFNLIQRLSKDKLLGKKNIHLLELSGFQFLKAYQKGQRFFRIRSLNTLYPVLLGAFGKSLENTKKKLKVPDKYHALVFQPSTLERIKSNITYMKEYK